MLFDAHGNGSNGTSHQPAFIGLADAGRTFICVGATTFDDALTTMAVDVNGDYVFVSYAPAPAQYMFAGIRYLA